MPNVRELENALPVAPLKVLAMESAASLGARVNDYLVSFRKDMKSPAACPLKAWFRFRR